MSTIRFPAYKARRKRKAAKPNHALRAALEQSMGKVGYALNQLMTRPKINWSWKLEEEARLSIQLADRLRALTTQYYDTDGAIGLRAVWFHVPNEGARSAVTAIILRAMGMLRGAFDFVFIWKDGGAMIELKAGANDLTPEQIYFERWALAFGANKSVCRNVDDAVERLISWGAIVGIPPRVAGDVTKGE